MCGCQEAHSPNTKCRVGSLGPGLVLGSQICLLTATALFPSARCRRWDGVLSLSCPKPVKPQCFPEKSPSKGPRMRLPSKEGIGTRGRDLKQRTDTHSTVHCCLLEKPTSSLSERTVFHCYTTAVLNERNLKAPLQKVKGTLKYSMPFPTCITSRDSFG